MTDPTPCGPAAWPDLLDALEERNRRTEAALRGGGELPAPVALDAGGPLPPPLRLRAEALLADTSRLERLAAVRVEAAGRARRYGAA